MLDVFFSMVTKVIRFYEKLSCQHHLLDSKFLPGDAKEVFTRAAKDNKKFQVSKIATGARNREYIGSVEWLANAGIINPCYCMEMPELPLKGNYNPAQYKIYFKDIGLLIV